MSLYKQMYVYFSPSACQCCPHFAMFNREQWDDSIKQPSS